MRKAKPSRRAAFTLPELMMVVLIIALLATILVPVVSSGLATANRVAQRAQLNSISAACENYQQTFDAYPGYFSERYLDNQALTANEGLVLSLMGRVKTSGDANDVTFPPKKNAYVDPNDIGTGPMVRSGRTYGAFYNPQSGEVARAKDGAGNDVGLSVLPELLDTTNALPILYFRSRGGGASQPVSYNWSSGHYTLNTNSAYFTTTLRSKEDKEALFRQNHGTVGSSLNPRLAGSRNDAADNLAWFAINGQLSNISASGNGAANGNDDVVRGSFMLMSAGEDGLFLSNEQLQESGSGPSFTVRPDNRSAEEAVQRFDDVVVSGG